MQQTNRASGLRQLLQNDAGDTRQDKIKMARRSGHPGYEVGETMRLVTDASAESGSCSLEEPDGGGAGETERVVQA